MENNNTQIKSNIKWYDCKNYDRKKEAIRVCAKCGHVSEMHSEGDDYDNSNRCLKKDCKCEQFVCKVENDLIVYDED